MTSETARIVERLYDRYGPALSIGVTDKDAGPRFDGSKRGADT